MPITALAARHRIFLAMIWPADGLEDRVAVADHLRSTRLQMVDGASVEDDVTPVRIDHA
jgi:hypothetical protein